MKKITDKKVLIVVATVAFLVLGVAFYLVGSPSSLTTGNERVVYDLPGIQQEVERPEYSLRFKYNSGPDGFSLIESNPVLPEVPELEHITVIMETPRYVESQNGVRDINSIPSITVIVFNKPQRTTTDENGATTTESVTLSLEEWVRTHPALTKYNDRVGEIETTKIDGRDSLTFMADDVFKSQTYVTQYRGNYYIFNGQFENEDSLIRTAFKAFIDSVILE